MYTPILQHPLWVNTDSLLPLYWAMLKKQVWGQGKGALSKFEQKGRYSRCRIVHNACGQAGQDWGRGGVKTGRQSCWEPRQALSLPPSCLFSKLCLCLCKNPHGCPQRLCLFPSRAWHWLLSDPDTLCSSSRTCTI